MEQMTIYTGKPVIMDRDHVDTDQIIPKQFLKRIERTGFGRFLFYDWRYEAENVERPTVVYAGRSVPSKTGISAYSFEDDWIS